MISKTSNQAKLQTSFSRKSLTKECLKIWKGVDKLNKQSLLTYACERAILVKYYLFQNFIA